MCESVQCSDLRTGSGRTASTDWRQTAGQTCAAVLASCCWPFCCKYFFLPVVSLIEVGPFLGRLCRQPSKKNLPIPTFYSNILSKSEALFFSPIVGGVS